MQYLNASHAFIKVSTIAGIFLVGGGDVNIDCTYYRMFSMVLCYDYRKNTL